MKKMFLTLLSAAFVTLVCAQGAYQAPDAGRVSKVINTQWTFNYFADEKADKGGYENPAFDDSTWSCVSVPHTWQTYETTRELHPYIRNISEKDNPHWWKGWGWYRKHIVIGKEHAGKKVNFEFDGVQKYSRIYLNGRLIGEHKGGFTSFYADATDAVRFGEDNVLVVAVNNALNDRWNIAPMNAGNWAVYGGIIRDVRIVIADRVSVPFQGSYLHEGGTFITTPDVSAKQATIDVKSWVGNQTPQDKNVRVVTVLTDSTGLTIAKTEEKALIKAGEIHGFQHAVKVKNPMLWSPETPYIYNAYTEVYDGNRLSDVYHSTFGIRSISWDYDLHRLVLNGKVTHLHGINRHEEYPWLGQAFPKWIAERDMLDMADGLEINYMRTAHYPNDPQVYYFMDRRGICINEELPNIKNQEFDPEVQEQHCREMIRRDRNHPSIIIWSMGNETDHACDSRFAWEEDKTRIITVRQPYNDSYNPKYCRHTDKEMPVESYLRCTIRGWYDTDDRNLEPDDSQWAGTEAWQHQKSIGKNLISDHNGTVWLYADHGADREYVGAPLKHVNPKGWVDSWRTPKYVYYLWQANFAQKPMVHIQPHFWRSQYVGQKKDFTVDSNCDKVELFVNGKSFGTQSPTKSGNYVVTFKGVPVSEGTLEAVGTRKDGSRVVDKVVMAGVPAAIVVKATSPAMMSTPDHIGEVWVDIVDKDGVHVYGAINTLKFTVEGPATLVGPEIYISDRDKSEEYEGTMYIDAPVRNLIRATGKPGKVTVTVSSTGLTPASVTFDVLPYVDRAPVTGITEPALNPDGRQPVAINRSQANYLKAPVEMKDYAGEVSIPAAKKDLFRTLAKEFIVAQNPSIDTRSIDFGYVLDAFEAILNSTLQFTGGERGYIVADDYNFISGQYNVSRAITNHIASKELPQAYRDAMTDYYARDIIAKGKDRNYLAENELIDRIPAGGTVVFTGASSALPGVKCIDTTDARQIVLTLYPEVSAWSQGDQKKAFNLVSRINPTVTYKSVRDKKTKTKTDTYTAEKNSVVLVPDVKKLRTSFPERNL